MFFKKKKTCDCCKCNQNSNEQTDKVITPKFIVLGACCKKSADMFQNTIKAVKNLGFEDTVLNIGDMAEIAKYGVMQTPALVINGKVVSYGKLLTVEQIEELIKK